MIINSARFMTSNASVEKTPDTKMHEYAFIGRSNVGKSSLINMLTGKKGLAMTSSTPGKTMLINHFVVNEKWCIVDLPGYGFAQRSKKDLAKIDKMIRDYILGREQMTNLFLLIDSRHAPQKIDMNFMEWLAENSVPFSIIFTKLDKISATAGNKNVASYCEKLLEQWEELPPIFISSSKDGRGRKEILDYIEQLNKLPLLDESDKEIPENDNYKGITMNKDTKQSINDANETKAVDNLPGASVDVADKEKVNSEEVDERTDTLDFNPHSEGL